MQPTSLTRIAGWRAALALTLASAAALVACGGGGSDAGTPGFDAPVVTASANYAEGPISGFGSVVVGGVRYDDSKADVRDDDDASHDRSALKLGMVVQISAGAVDRTAGTATAARVRFGSETVGPIGAVDIAASTVVVLGQTVVITANTVFDSSLAGGLTALAAKPAGTVVEVHGILDQSTGKITATRVELASTVTSFKLRGMVTALDTTAKTFKIGSELISYSGIATIDVPSNLANGALVRVKLQTTRVAGAWVATRVRSGVRMHDSSPDAHVEGNITLFTSATNFEINGLKVDATNARFEDGNSGIVLGARVEVSGSIAGGVLLATKVEIEDRRDGGKRQLELHGDISTLDVAAKTFVLRAVTVSYAGAVAYKDGVAANLAAGKRVEVRGVLSSDRTRLEAQRIEFK